MQERTAESESVSEDDSAVFSVEKKRPMHDFHAIASWINLKQLRHIQRKVKNAVLYHHILCVEDIGASDYRRKVFPEFI